MASGSFAYGGSVGGGFRLYLESHEVSVDTANNRSLIEITLQMQDIANEGNVYNNASTPWSISGTESLSGGFSYNFTGAGQNVTPVNGNQYWVTHNNDGTGSVSLSCSHDAQNSPYLTTASGSISYNLTTIQRYANITGFSLSNANTHGFTINATTDQSCSLIEWWINGVYHSQSTSGTSWTIPVTGLNSDTTYSVYIRVTDAASGLTTTSGTNNINTLPTAFFDATF